MTGGHGFGAEFSVRHLPPEVSGLQHSYIIRIAGHFSAHGMPDGPYVVVPFRVRSCALDDAL